MNAIQADEQKNCPNDTIIIFVVGVVGAATAVLSSWALVSVHSLEV